MKLKIVLLTTYCLLPVFTFAQKVNFDGEFTSELQWDMKSNFNWVNLLRMDLQYSPWKGGSFELATLHMAKTKEEAIIEDMQGFSNIEEDNNYAAIAVLGYHHSWECANLFAGVRNTNEDFFVSECTSLFTNSSPGIFPTISANYPIANYPVSGLTVYFDVTLGGFTLRNSIYNGVAYNGWEKHDNPFIVNPKRDGIFDEMELTYEWDKGFYSLGAAVHDRFFSFDDDFERGFELEKKTSAAIWLYGEQTLWEDEDNDTKLSLMAQYSENTNRDSECVRYAELGFVCNYISNDFGISAQYAKFQPGNEISVEVTYKHEFNEHVYIQPAFTYIHNPFGNFVPLVMRLGLLF